MSDVPGLEITYYSVGCFLLRWRGVAILTDPFWSHLPLRQVAFGRTESDPSQVDAYLDDLSEVRAVLVGHSHYDHVLDLPYVAPHLAEDAQVFGSRTLAHTLAPLELPLDVQVMNPHVATPDQPGRWFSAAGGRIRVLPIASGHPNNYAFIHLFTERLREDRSAPPTHSSHFQEGITLAFLVDLMDDDGQTIVHRIYVETSSRGWPDGFFPQSILDAHGVDVALLAMDCANIESRGGDSIIDYLQPTTVLFCHWENFFRTKDQAPREIVKVNLSRSKRWFENDPRLDYVFPYWDSRYFFPDR
jgi:L-ascorbate metabolism protein UlaG (beta-lactamase superfamily)